MPESTRIQTNQLPVQVNLPSRMRPNLPHYTSEGLTWLKLGRLYVDAAGRIFALVGRNEDILLSNQCYLRDTFVALRGVTPQLARLVDAALMGALPEFLRGEFFGITDAEIAKIIIDNPAEFPAIP